MPVCLLIEEGFELNCIDEVAIVCKTYSIWTVDEERLGFRIGTRSGGRISEMSKSCRRVSASDAPSSVDDRPM